MAGRGRPPVDPLQRFLAKCRFDPVTGCVVWTGGRTTGQGHNAPYGAFWFEGRRWFAHRWAAMYIHGQDITGLQVDHCCPNTGGLPNTLCVQHLQAVDHGTNRTLQTERGRVVQTANERQYWLFVQKGIEPARDTYEPSDDGIPFFSPPSWLASSPAPDEAPF